MSALKVGPFWHHPSSIKTSLTTTHAAFLFGWTDGSFRNLEKYKSIYHNKGLDVYVMESTSRDFFMHSRINALCTPASLQQLSSHVFSGKNAKKAVVHCFSNGGMHSFHRVNELLRSSNSKLDISHMILDSLPGGENANTSSIAMTTLVHPYIRPLARAFVYTLITLLNTARSFMYPTRGWNPIKDAREYLLTMRVPQLYLYSRGDTLIPYTDVEDHIRICDSQGIDVERKCWIDSGHVQHYRKYPEAYSERIYEFLKI